MALFDYDRGLTELYVLLNDGIMYLVLTRIRKVEIR